jgi:hypothetical protein
METSVSSLSSATSEMNVAVTRAQTPRVICGARARSQARNFAEVAEDREDAELLTIGQ